MQELTNLQTAEERTAASRSRLYQLLGIGFGFPDEELYGAILDGTFAGAIAEACTALPYDLPAARAPELRTGAESYTDFESEYIRLFDVGPAGPPCPLYGGVHGGDRMKVMEEAVRFYNFFQLHLSTERRELPDHITTELEFLHYLTFREAEARQRHADPLPLLRAERDFLGRHLCRWVPRLEAKLGKQDPLPFFPALVRCGLSFFEADRDYAAAICGE